MGNYSTSGTCLSISAYLPILEQSIRGLRYYKGGIVVVERKGHAGLPEHLQEIRRGKITMLTKRARQKMFFTIATSGIDWKSMITLTFGETFPNDGQQTKVLLNRALEHLRRNYGCSYFWFLEFQARGAPHIHIIVTEPAKRSARNKLARFWSRLLKKKLNLASDEQDRVERVHAHWRTWQNIKEQDGAVRYAAKYAHKTKQKAVPPAYQDVGRFWGCSRDVKPQLIDEEYTDGLTLRMALKEFKHPAADWQIIPQLLYGIHLKPNRAFSEELRKEASQE